MGSLLSYLQMESKKQYPLQKKTEPALKAWLKTWNKQISNQQALDKASNELSSSLHSALKNSGILLHEVKSTSSYSIRQSSEKAPMTSNWLDRFLSDKTVFSQTGAPLSDSKFWTFFSKLNRAKKASKQRTNPHPASIISLKNKQKLHSTKSILQEAVNCQLSFDSNTDADAKNLFRQNTN